jgi:hypothetical protein
MTSRKGRILVLAIPGMLALGGVAAHAGSRIDINVTVVKNADGSGYADGAMGSVRNTPDGIQQIGCHVTAYTKSVQVLCNATATTGAFLSCTSTLSSMAQAAASITSDSEIHFGADAKGNCTFLEVNAQSAFAPRQ